MTDDMKNVTSWFRRFKAVLFVIVIALFAYLLIKHAHELSATIRDHASAIIYTCILNSLLIALQAYNFIGLLPNENRTAFLKTFNTWALANLTNYLGPFQPGLAVRAAFFKSENIPIKLTMLVTLRQLSLSIWIAMGIAGIGVLSDNSTIRNLSLTSIVLFLATPLVWRKIASIISNFLSFSKTNMLFDNFNPGLFQLLLVSGQYIVNALTIYGVYYLFNAPLEIHETLLLSVIFALSTILSLTPNNLGVQEALVGYAAHLGGLSAVDAIGIALVFRIAHVLSCIMIVLATSQETALKKYFFMLTLRNKT